MESKGVSIPWIHEHLMVPCNIDRQGRCCGRFGAASSDGYNCESCYFFVHKKCVEEVHESIMHPSHPAHPLYLLSNSNFYNCNLCGMFVKNMFYRCMTCDFNVDLCCARYPPPEVIVDSKMHRHKLILVKENFALGECAAKCEGTDNYPFPYKCGECDITFHVDCIWQPNIAKNTEVNHPYHSLHPLTLFTGKLPEYSDGKCRLCGRKIKDRLFYHCSSCNFTLDMQCVIKPPAQILLDVKAHDHQLTLLPRLDSFTCNACGLKGDRSPYACSTCGFMIHRKCLKLPRVININRHDHRVSRTSVLGVVDSICGVCRKKVDWTYGGYSCQRCPGYVVHSKCATRKDVWNGKELEGIPEEIEDIEPYVVIDENTIQHFSHKEHYLRLHLGGVLYEENKRCSACIRHIGFQSFYGCIDCDFILHQSCAELPKRKWHVLHNDSLTLVTSTEGKLLRCTACDRLTNGFLYKDGRKKLDVWCSSISEPFDHPSHPDHPLYHIPRNAYELCNGCNKEKEFTLRCIGDGCEFILCFNCASLPQVVKHRVDDHPLLLCYGGEKATGKYWCDICEAETSPENWYYTCKDHRASLHIECVLGDYAWALPRNRISKDLDYGLSDEPVFEPVFNNSVSRPFCEKCGTHCMYSVIMEKTLGTSVTYRCSNNCSS